MDTLEFMARGAGRKVLRTAGKPTAQSGRQARASRLHLWYLILIFAAVGIVYSNSFRSGMVFDNEGILAQDPRIRAATLENIRQIFHGGYWYGSPGAGLYRPLTTISYLLNFAVLGNASNPSGYHSINLCIHLA